MEFTVKKVTQLPHHKSGAALVVEVLLVQNISNGAQTFVLAATAAKQAVREHFKRELSLIKCPFELIVSGKPKTNKVTVTAVKKKHKK